MEPGTTQHQQSTSRLFPLLGAALGGLLGYFAFGWLAHQGFYAVALPGALLGAGAGLFLKQRSMALAITCGVAALALGIFSEWRIFPFIADPGFGYFLAHLHLLPPVKLLMLLLGGVFGFWFSLGRRRQILPVVPPNAG